MHQEYVRIVPGARRAVLFLHGIVGTPRHFDTLLTLVQQVPESDSVYSILLDGHGGSVSDFSRSSMKKWKAQVWDVFDALAEGHEEVVIAAHSMGTLFALQLAAQQPDKIPFLFLLAVPLRPWPRLFGIGNMLRLVFGQVREDNPTETATRDACGVEPTWRVWRYLGWIPRILELFSEICRTENVLGVLTVPCVAFQSRRDELVRNSTSPVLSRYAAVNVQVLPDSTHFYYAPGDRARIIEHFGQKMKKHD